MINVWWNYGVIDNSILENHTTYINKLSMKQFCNMAPRFFKCGDSKNSFSFKSYGPSIEYLLFSYHGKLILLFLMAVTAWNPTWQQCYTVSRDTPGEGIASPNYSMDSVMPSNIVDGL